MKVKKNLCVHGCADVTSLNVDCNSTMSGNLVVKKDITVRDVCVSGRIRVNDIAPKTGGTVTVGGDLVVDGSIEGDVSGVTGCFNTVLVDTIVPKTGETVTVAGLQLGPDGLHGIFSYNYPPNAGQNIVPADAVGFTAGLLTGGTINTHHIYDGPNDISFGVDVFVQNNGLTANTLEISEIADPDAPDELVMGTVSIPASFVGFATVTVAPTLNGSLWYYTNLEGTSELRLYSTMRN